jgi:hypothetical protein
MNWARRLLPVTLVILFFFGWVHYPGGPYTYWFNWGEYYAYPASLSKPCDPHWGFWFW